MRCVKLCRTGPIPNGFLKFLMHWIALIPLHLERPRLLSSIQNCVSNSVFRGKPEEVLGSLSLVTMNRMAFEGRNVSFGGGGGELGVVSRALVRERC
jgi:hypothetical protein